jgi:4'-phosphopantetheinyl transferase
LVACAITAESEIGVDAEAFNPKLDAISIAKSFFASAECDMLAGLSKDEVAHAFFALWTLKEAIVKAIGRGLSVAFRDFTVLCDPPSVAFEDYLMQDAASWTLDSLLLPQHHLAVALIRGSRGPSPSNLQWQRVELTRLD